MNKQVYNKQGVGMKGCGSGSGGGDFSLPISQFYPVKEIGWHVTGFLTIALIPFIISFLVSVSIFLDSLMKINQYKEMYFTYNLNIDRLSNNYSINTVSTTSIAEVPVDEETMKQMVYNLYHYKGYSDIAIAGIIGNWTHESGIDPTSIEGIYGDTKYTMNTKRKITAANDLNAHYKNVLSKQFKNDFYKCYIDDKHYPGIGLGQMTGANAYRLIKASEEFGRKWWEAEFQLAYISNYIPTIGLKGYDEKVYKKFEYRTFKDAMNSQTTPESAASYFLSKWEGISDTSKKRRMESARQFYNEIDKYRNNYNQEQGKRIKDLSEKTYEFRKSIVEVIK